MNFPKITDIGHFLGGVLVAYLTNINPLVAIIISILFCLYEMDEGWHIQDESFVDIKNFLLGVIAGAIVYIIVPLILKL